MEGRKEKRRIEGIWKWGRGKNEKDKEIAATEESRGRPKNDEVESGRMEKAKIGSEAILKAKININGAQPSKIGATKKKIGAGEESVGSRKMEIVAGVKKIKINIESIGEKGIIGCESGSPRAY